MSGGFGTGQLLQSRGQTGVDANQSAPIGLVFAMLAGIWAVIGQSLHLRRDANQHQRGGQLRAQEMHFAQMVAQHGLALATQGQLQRGGGHVGIAIAVAADPVAHSKKHLVDSANALFHVLIQPRNLFEKGRFKVRQRVFNFIGHLQLGVAQQAGLPQLRHARAQLHLQRGFIPRGQIHRIARRQDASNGPLGIQNAFALHLGRVGCEHRGDIGRFEHFGDALGGVAAGAQSGKRRIQAAVLNIAAPLVDRAAADVMPVFRQVGQMAEIGEGANHAHCLLIGQRFKQALQIGLRLRVGMAPKGHRQLAHLLHDLVNVRAFLLADDIAQNSPQEANIFDQRAVFVFFGISWGGGKRDVHAHHASIEDKVFITGWLRLKRAAARPETSAL